MLHNHLSKICQSPMFASRLPILHFSADNYLQHVGHSLPAAMTNYHVHLHTIFLSPTNTPTTWRMNYISRQILVNLWVTANVFHTDIDKNTVYNFFFSPFQNKPKQFYSKQSAKYVTIKHVYISCSAYCCSSIRLVDQLFPFSWDVVLTRSIFISQHHVSPWSIFII